MRSLISKLSMLILGKKSDRINILVVLQFALYFSTEQKSTVQTQEIPEPSKWPSMEANMSKEVVSQERVNNLTFKNFI